MLFMSKNVLLEKLSNLKDIEQAIQKALLSSSKPGDLIHYHQILFNVQYLIRRTEWRLSQGLDSARISSR